MNPFKYIIFYLLSRPFLRNPYFLPSFPGPVNHANYDNDDDKAAINLVIAIVQVQILTCAKKYQILRSGHLLTYFYTYAV